MAVKRIDCVRDFYYTKVSWLLFLLVIMVTLLVPSRKLSANIYKFFVVVPVIAMLSTEMIKSMFENMSVRWLALLSLYFMLSMVWGPSIDQVDNHFVRILGVWAFLFLVHGIARYHPEFFLRVDEVMVGFGVVWTVILLINWESLWQPGGPEFDLLKIPYGVFTHHVQIGWMLAALCLLALQRALRQAGACFCWLGCGLFFFVVLICTQARGGYLVFGAGLLAWALMGDRLKKWPYVLSVFVALSGAVLVVFKAVPGMFSSILLRGSAGRFEIWRNWYDLWSSDILKAIFGFGLNHPTENVFSKHVAAHFHSFYLNSLFYVGIVGFVLVGGWIVCSLRTYAAGQSLSPQWYPVVIGMLVGFLTDGDKLFNYPGAFVFCFVLPVFCLSIRKDLFLDAAGKTARTKTA